MDLRLLQLLRSQLDGMPLELASRLLPPSTRLRPGLPTHVHLQAASERRVAEGRRVRTMRHVSDLLPFTFDDITE